MKRIFTVFTLIIILICATLPASALTIEYDGTTTEYTGSIYDLYVNGNKLSLPLEPIIFNDRALVPVREVFEALGATVAYQEKTKCVDISYNGNNISLYINNPAAYINGKKAIIPDQAVPKLINKIGEPAKTMVPVRFISENLNMYVEFNSPVISITTYPPTSTPTPPPTATVKPIQTPSTGITSEITNISFADAGNATLTTTVTLSRTPGKLNAFILTNPMRLAVDIYQCNYKINSSYSVGMHNISKIRLGYENERSRLVFDAANISSATVTLNGNILTISIGTNGAPTNNVTIHTSGNAAPNPSPTPTPTPAPEISNPPYSNSTKLIVIDAGHGGKDGGATGYHNGSAVLEKNLTLQIAKRIKATLESRGYTVLLTRETDVYPSLQERADFANNSNAAIFVSIHINSVDSHPSASGTETFYASLNNDTSYGLKSSYLAKYIQDNLIATLGSKDRGVKQAEHKVTRSSIMPAVLVEVGFISNPTELSNMCSDWYQQKTAEAIAEGIIKGLDQITIPSNKDQLLAERNIKLAEWEKTQ